MSNPFEQFVGEPGPFDLTALPAFDPNAGRDATAAEFERIGTLEHTRHLLADASRREEIDAAFPALPEYPDRVARFAEREALALSATRGTIAVAMRSLDTYRQLIDFYRLTFGDSIDDVERAADERRTYMRGLGFALQHEVTIAVAIEMVLFERDALNRGIMAPDEADQHVLWRAWLRARYFTGK